MVLFYVLRIVDYYIIDPENNFMHQFIQNHPNLRPIVSIDIITEDGVKKISHIGFGTSLRTVTSNAITIHIDDQTNQIHRLWMVTVDILKVSNKYLFGQR